MQLVQDIYKIIENGEFIKWLIVTIITSLAIALTNTLIYIKLFSVEVKNKKNIAIVTIIEAFSKCIYSMTIPIYAYRIVCLLTEIAIYKIYFKYIMPLFGGGKKYYKEYVWLYESTQQFLKKKELILLYEKLGLKEIRHHSKMFGVCVMIQGKK